MSRENDVKWVRDALKVADERETTAAGLRQKISGTENSGGLGKLFNKVAVKPYYARKLRKAEKSVAAQKEWMQPRMAQILNDMGREAVIARDGANSRNAELVNRYDEALYLKTLGEHIDKVQSTAGRAIKEAGEAKTMEWVDTFSGNKGIGFLSNIETGQAADWLKTASNALEDLKGHLDRGSHSPAMGEAGKEINELVKGQNWDLFMVGLSDLINAYKSVENAGKLKKAMKFMETVVKDVTEIEDKFAGKIASARKDEMALVHKARDLQRDALMEQAKTTSDFGADFVKRLSEAASYSPQQPQSAQTVAVNVARKAAAPGRKQG